MTKLQLFHEIVADFNEVSQKVCEAILRCNSKEELKEVTGYDLSNANIELLSYALEEIKRDWVNVFGTPKARGQK